jgi:hypothetical protein
MDYDGEVDALSLPSLQEVNELPNQGPQQTSGNSGEWV